MLEFSGIRTMLSMQNIAFHIQKGIFTIGNLIWSSGFILLDLGFLFFFSNYLFEASVFCGFREVVRFNIKIGIPMIEKTINLFLVLKFQRDIL